MQSNQNPDLTSPDHLLDQEAKEDFTELLPGLNREYTIREYSTLDEISNI